MGRQRRIATQPNHRICNRCNCELPATTDVFLKDSTRPLGLAYECKACHRERKKGRDRRKERWGALTSEQRVLRKTRMKRWNQTQRGRATYLRKAYQRIDACDLSAEQILEMITQPCVYCGTETANRGLDRIDNDKPHIAGNVQTACTECNVIRSNRFSVEEMKLLGAVVARIRKARDSSCASAHNADHLGKLPNHRPR